MLENRSFDHMLGFLYADKANMSPPRQPFDGLNGHEANPDASGAPVTVTRIDPSGSEYVYFMPGATPAKDTGDEPPTFRRGQPARRDLRRQTADSSPISRPP